MKSLFELLYNDTKFFVGDFVRAKGSPYVWKVVGVKDGGLVILSCCYELFDDEVMVYKSSCILESYDRSYERVEEPIVTRF